MNHTVITPEEYFGLKLLEEYNRLLPGVILCTKDGRKMGNAIILDTLNTDEGQTRVFIETDYGNRLWLPELEVWQRFHYPNRRIDPKDWRSSKLQISLKLQQNQGFREGAVAFITFGNNYGIRVIKDLEGRPDLYDVDTFRDRDNSRHWLTPPQLGLNSEAVYKIMTELRSKDPTVDKVFCSQCEKLMEV